MRPPDSGERGLGHLQIMPDFLPSKIRLKPYESRPNGVIKPSFLPTLLPENAI